VVRAIAPHRDVSETARTSRIEKRIQKPERRLALLRARLIQRVGVRLLGSVALADLLRRKGVASRDHGLELGLGVRCKTHRAMQGQGKRRMLLRGGLDHQPLRGEPRLYGYRNDTVVKRFPLAHRFRSFSTKTPRPSSELRPARVGVVHAVTVIQRAGSRKAHA